MLLAGVWAWWARQEGAYFVTVLLPGAIVLGAALALMLLFAPSGPDLRRSRLPAIGLVALIGLGLWSISSALWSPAPSTAIIDGQRILTYALAFALGLWVRTLVGRRSWLVLVPIVVATVFAGATAVVGLLTGNDPREFLDLEGALKYPLGYRNANAAFFVVAAFAALGMASHAALDWRARGIALAVATLSIDLAILSQSRGSVPATVLATVVFILLAPVRVRGLLWVALAALPAVATVPAMSDLFTAASDEGVRNVALELHRAGDAVVITTGVALIAGLLAAKLEPRLPGLARAGKRSNRVVAVGFATIAVGCAIAFVVAVGDVGQWVDDRVDELSGGTPDFSSEESRFSLTAGSERGDLWRIAIDDAADEPLLGSGGGGYQYSMLRQVDYEFEARDAHSVELEILTELGAPGLLLLLTAIGAAAAAAWGARRLGAEPATVSAAALACATYWLAHSSIDWFWAYPAVTAPTLALLGAAAAPAVTAVAGRARTLRILLLAGVSAFALSVVPPFLSDRYVDSAFESWRSDLDGAYTDLGRAQDLNPLNDFSHLAEGAIARAAGDRERALEALSDAVDAVPEEFAGHYLLASLHAESDRQTARAEISRALELNPMNEQVRQLAKRLRVPVPKRP